jgi:hypothetical protein
MAIIILIIVSVLSAQDYVSRQLPFTKETMLGNNTSSSLLNPSRFSMRQSYSMSYSSFGGESDLSGLYLNRMTYQFEVPLTLQIDVGLFHKPMALFSDMPGNDGEKPAVLGIPHARLTWQPSEKFMMSVEYFQQQSGYSNSIFNSFDDPFIRRIR